MEIKTVPQDKIVHSKRGRKGKYNEEMDQLREFFTNGDYKNTVAKIFFKDPKELINFRQTVSYRLRDIKVRTNVEKHPIAGENLILYRD